MPFITDPVNPTGVIIVDGLNIASSAAWAIPNDFTPLLSPAAWRDGSMLVPHQRGRVPQPVIIDETEYKYRMLIGGDVNPSGVSYGEHRDQLAGGLASNIALLRQKLDAPDPVEVPTGTVTTYYEASWGTTYVAECQFFLDVTAEAKFGFAADGRPTVGKRCLLTIRLPDGLFEPAPS